MISLLLLFGACRQRWKPLWPPLLIAGKQFVESISCGRIELNTPLFQHLTLNPGKALLLNPFQRGYHHQIG
jgi:hypothetical protein